MIGGALLLKAAAGFVAEHWRTFVLALLVLAVLAFVYVTGRKHERQVWQPRLEQLQAAHASATAVATAERAALEVRHAEARQAIVDHYQERIHAGTLALDAALERMRDATRRRPLAPAAAAPAPCRDYAAAPSQLSEQDREFLVRLGAEADAVVEQLGACQRYAVNLHRICSAPGE
jgi:hypothetical protein